MDEKRIPQVQPWIGREEAEAAAEVIRNNWITEGAKSREFAKSLNELIDVPYGVFAPNGTLALVLGLMAIGIQPGEEVLIPNITFIASANAVLMVGGIPIPVEVESRTYQIDVAKARHLVNAQTRAIMPVHLYGTACNLEAVVEFAKEYNLLVIEDAAQGIGVLYKGRHVGGFGDVGCFSFFADKTITTGEGGYVVCRQKEIYEKLCLLRNQGRLHRGSFIHPMVGYNFRITDMQAAIGLVQLSKLDEIISKKLKIYQHYRSQLEQVSQVRVLEAEEGSTFVPFRCVLIAERAQDLMKYMELRGIESRTFFYPLHKQPCLSNQQQGIKSRKFDDSMYANSIFGYEHGLTLPIYPSLTAEDIGYITTQIKNFYSQKI